MVETRGLQVNYSPSWTRAIIRMPHGHSSFPSSPPPPRVSYTTSSSLRPPLDLRRFTLRRNVFASPLGNNASSPYLTFRFTITRIAYNCRCREARRLYFAFEPPSTVPQIFPRRNRVGIIARTPATAGKLGNYCTPRCSTRSNADGIPRGLVTPRSLRINQRQGLEEKDLLPFRRFSSIDVSFPPRLYTISRFYFLFWVGFNLFIHRLWIYIN